MDHTIVCRNCANLFIQNNIELFMLVIRNAKDCEYYNT
jgi:hypothetical protein